MPLRKFLILRKPRSGCLEGRTALIQPFENSFTGSRHEFELVAPVYAPGRGSGASSSLVSTSPGGSPKLSRTR